MFHHYPERGPRPSPYLIEDLTTEIELIQECAEDAVSNLNRILDIQVASAEAFRILGVLRSDYCEHCGMEWPCDPSWRFGVLPSIRALHNRR